MRYKPKEFAYNKLMALGLLTKGRQLSAKGSELMDTILQSSHFTIQKDVLDKEFKKFWEAYPDSDEFRHWAKTRPFKTGERKAKRLFWSILSEGKVTTDQIIQALEREKAMRAKNSLKTNEFGFMKGAVNWLTERVYEAYLDADNKTNKDDETMHGQDIV